MEVNVNEQAMAVRDVITRVPIVQPVIEKAMGRTTVWTWMQVEGNISTERANQIVLSMLYQKAPLNDFLYALKAMEGRGDRSIESFHGTASLLWDQSFMSKLKEETKVVKSYLPGVQFRKGSINIFAAPPGRGKSYYLLNEAVYQAHEGRKVRFFVLGDLDATAVYLRTYRIIQGFTTLGMAISKEQMNNLHFHIYPAGVATIDMIDALITESDDIVVIDYDDNVKVMGTGNLYNDSAIIYEYLTKQKQSGKVILIASQGKVKTWQGEDTTGVLASSSRKEHIADSIVLFRSKGTMEVVKDRHFLMGGLGVKGEFKIENYIFKVTPSIKSQRS